MYKLYLFTLICFISGYTQAQSCFHPISNIIPVSYYQQNNQNAYVYFSGDSTFLRGPHSAPLNFVSLNSNYKVDISFRVSISEPGVIMGQNFNGYGWYIGFDQYDSNKLKFFMCQSPYDIQTFEIPASSPPYDTNWVNFRIVYDKLASTFETYQNSVLAHSYTNIHWDYTEDVGTAFALGAGNITIHYGFDDYSAKDFFRGSIDDLLIKVDNETYINVNFNWGGGQFALDSASFFQFDRVWADIPGNVMHGFSFGNTNGADRYDPAWIKLLNYEPSYSTLGTGFSNWSEQNPVQSKESWQANSVVFRNNLYVTGNHNRVNGTQFEQGDPSYGISRWDSASSLWRNVSGGLNGYGLHVDKWLSNSNTEYLVVTGVFDKLHGTETTVNNIALWDGTAWSALEQPFTNFSGITNSNNTVAGFITESYQGDLVCGGQFNSAGGVPANNIARWKYNPEEGKYFWDKMGNGLGSPSNESVYSLAVYNNTLYAGGNFSTVSGAGYTSGLVKWDNTFNRWVPVDIPEANKQRIIQVLYVYDNKLWAGGCFEKISGVTCNGIAYFDGNSWHSIGSGNAETGLSGCNERPYGGEVTDMVSDGFNLYICGSFEKVNGKLCNKIAMYNKESWCALGYGVDLRPEGLSIFNDKLVITGDLYSAEGINMNNIALYDISNFTPIGIIDKTGTVSKFSLSQNYPNPFNPETKIIFNIPMAGQRHAFDVHLVIYDILGREVTTLINSKLEPGEHEAIWNASGYPSGVYFYKLTAGNYTGTKKMVLIK